VPPDDAIVSELHAIKSGRVRPATPPIAAVLHLMRHCEHRIADAPRQKMGGMTVGRAGESFAFSPDDLFRDADPIEQYSRSTRSVLGTSILKCIQVPAAHARRFGALVSW
jgi:hypothetical protein